MTTLAPRHTREHVASGAVARTALEGARSSAARLPLTAAALFVLVASMYAWSIDLRATRGASITGDEPFYLLTTQSLLREGDLDLRNQYEWQSYREFFDHAQPLWLQSADRPGEPLLSPHGPGLSVYLLPGFALGGLLGVQVQLLLTAAATYALVYVLIASTSGRLLWPWLATAGVALSPPAFVYATEVYPEVLASACLVVALLALRDRGGTRSAIVTVVAVSVLAWLGTKYVPLGVVLGLAALSRLEGREARATFLGLSIASGALYVGWHLATFGALTPYSASWAWAGDGTSEVLRDHLVPLERAYRLTGLFVDERFGVGRWAPQLLLTLPALAILARRGALGGLAAALVVVQLAMATFVALTMMGWWFPGRTLVAVLPMIAWALAELLAHAPRRAQAGIAMLTVYALAITVALVLGVRGGDVVIAVDPFALPSRVFGATSLLFPDYRAWRGETVALHIGWSALLALGTLRAATRRLAR